MKVLIVLMVLCGAGIWAVYHFGVAGFDPAAQATDFTTAVQPGQTWQAVTAEREPSRYSSFYMKNGELLQTPAIKFKADRFADLMQNNPPAEGFVFHYVFSADHQYDVSFDGSGIVLTIGEPITVKTLLNL